jgi:signal transduction histidine kinase
MHERAALLGGQLAIRSEPGRGTEVSAWFPLTLTPPSEQGTSR